MFFMAEWIIERNGIGKVIILIDRAADLNCILWHRSFSTPDGLRGAKFIIRVPSPEIFQSFENNIQDLPFKNWHPVELNESEVLPLDHPVRISELSGNLQSTFEGGFLESANYNEMIKKRNLSLKDWLV